MLLRRSRQVQKRHPVVRRYRVRLVAVVGFEFIGVRYVVTCCGRMSCRYSLCLKSYLENMVNTCGHCSLLKTNALVLLSSSCSHVNRHKLLFSRPYARSDQRWGMVLHLLRVKIDISMDEAAHVYMYRERRDGLRQLRKPQTIHSKSLRPRYLSKEADIGSLSSKYAED